MERGHSSAGAGAARRAVDGAVPEAGHIARQQAAVALLVDGLVKLYAIYSCDVVMFGMPNPKLGTVTPDVAGAVKAAKAGQIEFRVEKQGIVHAGVGKASFSEEALSENISAFVSAIAKAKPSGAKGTYMKKVSVSSTMGPGLKLDVAALTAE